MLYDLDENYCVDMLISLVWEHFWIVKLFGIVKPGQCWSLAELCVGCGFEHVGQILTDYGNLVCRQGWVSSSFIGMEIYGIDVWALFSMGVENKIFFGLDICLGPC